MPSSILSFNTMPFPHHRSNSSARRIPLAHALDAGGESGEHFAKIEYRPSKVVPSPGSQLHSLSPSRGDRARVTGGCYTFSMTSICAPSGQPAHIAGRCCKTPRGSWRLLFQLCKRAGVIVGLHRDVLDAVTLFMVLRRDDGRNVELQAHAGRLEAAARHFPLQGRAEIVDIKLRRPLGSSWS